MRKKNKSSAAAKERRILVKNSKTKKKMFIQCHMTKKSIEREINRKISMDDKFSGLYCDDYIIDNDFLNEYADSRDTFTDILWFKVVSRINHITIKKDGNDYTAYGDFDGYTAFDALEPYVFDSGYTGKDVLVVDFKFKAENKDSVYGILAEHQFEIREK